jgi:carbonic anhydrase/acetyltransferase-like protein (isoleucine patch superfamily)
MNKPILKQSEIVDVGFGKNVIVVKLCNLYGCIIHDDVFIGPFTEIQKDVEIGRRTKTHRCDKLWMTNTVISSP